MESVCTRRKSRICFSCVAVGMSVNIKILQAAATRRIFLSSALNLSLVTWVFDPWRSEVTSRVFPLDMDSEVCTPSDEH